jgi:hypothetical protein
MIINNKYLSNCVYLKCKYFCFKIVFKYDLKAIKFLEDLSFYIEVFLFQLDFIL